MTGRQVAADHHKLVIPRPVSDRNARQRGYGYGTCHTWHHRHGDPGLDARQYFFITTREHEGVASLEADHEVSGPGPVDHDFVDRVLRHGPPVRDLGGVNDFHMRW